MQEPVRAEHGELADREGSDQQEEGSASGSDEAFDSSQMEILAAAETVSAQHI
jgi:hypothetical protein